MSSTQHTQKQVEQYMVDEVAGVATVPPPVDGIVARGRRNRTRQRVRTWGGAALAAVVVGGAAVAGAGVIGGDQGPTQALTADAPQGVDGKQVVVDGYAITVPADWDGTVVECPKGGGMSVTITAGVDPCRGNLARDPDVIQIGFHRWTPEYISQLTGNPIKPFEHVTAGRSHHAPKSECIPTSSGDDVCGGSVQFDDMVIQMSGESRASLPAIRDLLATVAVIGDDGVPVPLQN